MQTYVFPPRFYELIQQGQMRQSFQPPRSAHAKVGETMRLVVRFGAPLIADTCCIFAARCEIVWQAGHIAHVREAGMPLVHLGRFATACGYAGIPDMEEVLGREYGCSFVEGFVIAWEFRAAAGEVAA